MFSQACLIDEGNTFLLTGGAMAEDGKRLLEKVSRYREDAWLEDLDDLNFGRWDHACGWFVGSSGKRVRFISFVKLGSCYSQNYL